MTNPFYGKTTYSVYIYKCVLTMPHLELVCSVALEAQKVTEKNWRYLCDKSPLEVVLMMGIESGHWDFS